MAEREDLNPTEIQIRDAILEAAHKVLSAYDLPEAGIPVNGVILFSFLDEEGNERIDWNHSGASTISLLGFARFFGMVADMQMLNDDE